MAFVDQPIVVGDTIDFTLAARKDGAIWDITGAAVLLYLTKPDGTVLAPLTATISDGPAGAAHYQTLTTTLDTEGDWVRQWRVEKTGVVLWSGEIEFQVRHAAA